MAVTFQGGVMMYLGLLQDSFKDKNTGALIPTFKVNLMDTQTNEIHTMPVSAKNEVLLTQINGLKMASMVQLVVVMEYDKYAVNKKQNPTKFKLAEIYPA